MSESIHPSTPGLPAGLTRRQVVKAGLASAMTVPFLGPLITYGQGPNETLNIASCGVGGKGMERPHALLGRRECPRHRAVRCR